MAAGAQVTQALDQEKERGGIRYGLGDGHHQHMLHIGIASCATEIGYPRHSGALI